MKEIKSIFFIAVTALLASCSSDVVNDALASSDANGNIKDVTCTIPEPVVEYDDATRSAVTFSNSQLGFEWEDGEKIIVYGDAGNSGDFTLTSGAESKTGVFDGGGFSLTSGKSYYTISKSKSSYGTSQYNIPKINGSYDSFNADQYTNIKMSYAGQRQKYNGNANADNSDKATEHLGAYDYLTAVASANENNSCHFEYKRLGCILRLVFKSLSIGVKYKMMTMYDASDDLFRGQDRTVNITNTSSQTDYTPYYNDIDLTSTDQRYTIMLGEQDSNGDEQGLATTTEATSLVIYMMIPPVDLSNRTIVFRLTPVDTENNKPLFASYTRTTPFVANTAYSISLASQPSQNYNINVKVIQDWAKGNTVTQTRSTGDPGITTAFEKPKYLYAFFVNDGKLVARAYAEDIDAENWTDADGIYSYTGSWKNTSNGSEVSETTSLTLDASNSTNPRVYMVASNTQISSWKNSSGTEVIFAYGTESGTAESVIQGLSYDYDSQSQMLNLYSTPYVDGTSFVGTLGDEVKDVRLYHVAAKVDINWENTKTVTSNGYSVPSPLSGSVSLNNIPTTNLSFFLPTTNAATTSSTADADKTTLSTAITTGTAYYGRAVWYVPQIGATVNSQNVKAIGAQLAKASVGTNKTTADASLTSTYNVTIGSTTQDITFTPDATYTSWFRGLVTIK